LVPADWIPLKLALEKVTVLPDSEGEDPVYGLKLIMGDENVTWKFIFVFFGQKKTPMDQAW